METTTAPSADSRDCRADESRAYWNGRGANHFVHQGERFYTVTPVTLYIRRRELLLQRVLPLLEEPSVRRVLDFGCGDGWYLSHFQRRFPEKGFWGQDISEAMIERAHATAPEAHLAVSDGGIAFDVDFDLVYCFAVLAHVKDDVVESILPDVHAHLRPGARLVLFEQTGPVHREGVTWCRRPAAFYKRAALRAGFRLEDQALISFPLFSLYEKTLYVLLRRLLVGGRTHGERCIRANQSRVLTALSAAVLRCAGAGILPAESRVEGNTIFVFSKPAFPSCGKDTRHA